MLKAVRTNNCYFVHYVRECMQTKNYQELLSLVQMPSQYLGNEINSVKKNMDSVDLSFALVFPDLYEIGISHFGLQILYSILNSHERIAAERFYAPAPDMEAHLLENGIPALSLESKKDLKTFDIIGVSLLYELNFTNILTLFNLSGIPFFSEERRDALPLIIGGGPCTFNPEPLADFFDAFVIGDGEAVSLELAECVLAFKKEGDGKKESLLRLISRIEGLYVPSFFSPHYDATGLQSLVPRFEDYKKVRRAFFPLLTKESFPISPIIPFAKPVHDRLRLEIARGCSRACRFCQAGMIYRPVRERSLEDLMAISKASLKLTGHSDISLLSLSTGDYSNLTALVKSLHELGQGHCNAISLPSIRAEKLTPDLMKIIKQVRKTGFTIAPEAGSQRLRDIINKNLNEESILSTVENAFNLGWKKIKLYFMFGLPFELPEDIEAICTLSRRLALSYAKGKKTINVSVATFIPKPHTPFQRCAQLSDDEARDKLLFLKKNLRHPKLNLKWQDPKMSLLEGLWSRGDRRLSKLLITAFNKGCRLDAWADKFDFSLWQQAFEETGIDPYFYTTRQRHENEPLPWDHIDSGVLPGFLKKEFENAKDGVLTPDCRNNDCSGCGVCDFKDIKPILYDNEVSDLSLNHDAPEANEANEANEAKQLPDKAFSKFDLIFSKLDDARFFGHLELGTIFQRAVRRAGLNAKYSQGFNPLMKISFESALPLGMESEAEKLTIFFEKDSSPNHIIDLLNKELPQGLTITECRQIKNQKSQIKNPFVLYQVYLPNENICKEDIENFLKLDAFIVEDISKKGRVRKTDLRKAVENITLIKTDTLEMLLGQYNERTVRPLEVLTHCFNMDAASLSSARFKKSRFKKLN